LVNEQTEIGILLALPGLLGTLAFAPELMRIFYTTKFLSGAELLPWFVLGILGRVVSWPLGYVQLAKGASRWFAGTETFFVVLQFCLVMLLLSWIGLPGVAIAFTISYGLYVVAMLGVTHHLTRFRWSTSTLKTIAVAAAFVTAGFVAQYMLTDWAGLVVGGGLAAGSTGYSLRGMAKRLGPSHPLVRWCLRMPGGPWLCGVC
jgi:PST family polysaccharide transporter